MNPALSFESFSVKNQAMDIQKNIILASQSPRRKQLLAQAGLEFEILCPDIDEKALPFKGCPGSHAMELSRLKAKVVAEARPDSWVIGADTIVAAEDKLLEKPESRPEAIQMLETLNSRTHSVFTGFTVCCSTENKIISKAVETRVVFKELSKEEINWYTATKEPYDKAGGYGIQGVGAFMVKTITGSYSNVVGLPVCELIESLLELGVIQFKE